MLRRALREGDAETVVVLMAAWSDFWTVEGSHLKVVGLARAVEELIAGAPVPAGQVPALRAALTAVVINTLVFGDEATTRALRRLEELGPGDGGSRTEAHAKVMLAARLGLTANDAGALARLCEDPDRFVRQIALQWSSQVHENVGDIDTALDHAHRSLALTDDRGGPWTRAIGCAQLAGLTVQSGALDEALGTPSRPCP